ncbi:hypothetical protein CLD22_15810 [Rubrivivax gelatinosus]|nr:hypothetical protein [Rubrivivax gelatinosus]
MMTRSALKLAAVAATTLLAALPAQAADTAPVARHVILLIGDGMNIEHEIAASQYLSGRPFALSFHQLPYQGVQATWDVTTYERHGGRYDPQAIVPTLGYDPAKGGLLPYPLGPELDGARAYHLGAATDSASSATTWATGYKTDDGNLSWLPGDPDRGGNRRDDGSLKTIAERLREARGFAIGVVSTVPFTHATPAAFVAHDKSRKHYTAIGSEILQRTRPEVVIGGGHPGTSGKQDFGFIAEGDYTDLKRGRYAADTVFVERQAGTDGAQALQTAARRAAAEGKKLVGLYGKKQDGLFDWPEPQHRPGAPRIERTTTENPSYAEATLAALQVLARNPRGFFLMAEQGDIDWANHNNDYRHMVSTVASLHDGVKAVLEFVDRPGDDISWDNTLLIVTADHSNSYMRIGKALGAGELPEQRSDDCNLLTRCYPGGEVSYGSGGHSNELTRIYARGQGTELLKAQEGRWYPGTRIVDNTQLFHVMMQAAGVPVEPALKPVPVAAP